MLANLKRLLSETWDVLEIILIALAVALFIRYFIAQPFLVSGASMEPDFHDRNFLIVDEVSYRFRAPARGEVIVFKYPGNTKEYFIKRIIGLPGETLTVNGNVVTIDTKNGPLVLTEPYIAPDGRNLAAKTVTLDDHSYFVMGDNRGNSFDSRSWGTLDEKYITGVVRARLFPFDQIGIIHQIDYASSTK
jgi:signal peptidase I